MQRCDWQYSSMLHYTLVMPFRQIQATSWRLYITKYIIQFARSRLSPFWEYKRRRTSRYTGTKSAWRHAKSVGDLPDFQCHARGTPIVFQSSPPSLVTCDAIYEWGTISKKRCCSPKNDRYLQKSFSQKCLKSMPSIVEIAARSVFVIKKKVRSTYIFF